MKKAHYEIIIKAPKTEVAQVMLAPETYKEWTKVFNPNSTYEGNWKEGSFIKFFGCDDAGGEMGGMYSCIKTHKPAEFISIEHLGMILPDGTIDTDSDEVKKWTPAFENYTFTEVPEGTKLDIDMDIVEEYAEMFDGMWPKALQELRRVCEQSTQ